MLFAFSKCLVFYIVWRQRYLVPQRQYIQYQHYTSNLNLHCILSCYQGDNCSPYYRVFSIIRSPYKYPRTWAPRPCLTLLLLLLLFFCFLFFSCVICLFRLRTWGFTFQYCFFLLFCLLSYTNLRYITSYLSTSTRHPQDRASHLVPCPELFIIGHIKSHTWLRVLSFLVLGNELT